MRYLKDKYLIACSGGPDSMALLDMVRNKGLDIGVAHVNYHKRASAKRDEDIVKDYCLKQGIPFFKMDASENKKGNFQSYARVVRYSFFKEIIEKEGYSALLVAHHQDDLLETYIMQKQKGIEVSYYGLKRRNNLYGVEVIRPLLNKRKKDLQAYCDEHGIPYGIDESNLSDDYERNRIRNHLLKEINEEDRKELLREIRQLNKEKMLIEKDVKHFIGNKMSFMADKLLSYQHLAQLIRTLTRTDLSASYLEEIKRQLSNSDNLLLRIGDRAIAREGNRIIFGDYPEDYEVVVDSLRCLKHKHFKLCRKGSSFEGVTLSKGDFPLTIRNYHEGDVIEMKYGHKKISRFFIDHKIDRLTRLSYPVMVNREGTIILVPGLGCDKVHYSIKHNMFMVKL